MEICKLYLYDSSVYTLKDLRLASMHRSGKQNTPWKIIKGIESSHRRFKPKFSLIRWKEDQIRLRSPPGLHPDNSFGFGV